MTMKDNSEINKTIKLPQTINDIIEFLVSIKSVGVLTANRMIYRGGLHTLEIIQNSSTSLGKIKGVGPKKEIAIYIAVRDLYKVG
jgi:ERCC4-type nuclease